MALSSMVALFSGCEKDEPALSVPSDKKPAIRRIDPQQSNVLAKPGSTVSARFIMADNEELKQWEVLAEVLTNFRTERLLLPVNGRLVDTTIYRADTARQVIHLEDLVGNQADMVYEYRVPTLPTFSRIDLKARVYDVKDQQDTSIIRITVDFARPDTFVDNFQILTYERRDTLFHGLSTEDIRIAYNLQGRSGATPINEGDKDIQEASQDTSTKFFEAAITSPNNSFDPAALVVLSSDVFNYERTTYQTMRQAFIANAPENVTPPLKEGDIVILRMSLRHRNFRNYHHFAAIRIMSVVRDNAEPLKSYIVFQYKRSDDR
jgi:hypothetical protein